MIEKLKRPVKIGGTTFREKINELVDKVNDLTTNLDGQARTLVEQQAKISILEEHAHPTATTKPAENVQDRMIGCTTLEIPESYKNDQLTLATLDYSRKLEKENSDLKNELERTRKALEIAVDALKQIKDGKTPVSLGIYMDINDALEQITALEQKE